MTGPKEGLAVRSTGFSRGAGGGGEAGEEVAAQRGVEQWSCCSRAEWRTGVSTDSMSPAMPSRSKHVCLVEVLAGCERQGWRLGEG